MSTSPENKKRIAKGVYDRFRERTGYAYGWQHRMKRLYGISIETYMDMFNSQKGLCMICKEPESLKTSGGYTHMLAIDHNHSTGKIRALLCKKCNAVIGNAKESPEILQSAISYLLDYNE